MTLYTLTTIPESDLIASTTSKADVMVAEEMWNRVAERCEDIPAVRLQTVDVADELIYDLLDAQT